MIAPGKLAAPGMGAEFWKGISFNAQVDVWYHALNTEAQVTEGETIRKSLDNMGERLYHAARQVLAMDGRDHRRLGWRWP